MSWLLEEEGQVEHQMAKGISKRTMRPPPEGSLRARTPRGWPGFAEAVVEREGSREEGEW